MSRTRLLDRPVEFDRHAPVEFICEGCKERVTRPARAPWKPVQRFCSIACFSAAAKATGLFAGEKNPQFAGWKSRNKVAYRERYQAKYPEKAAAHKAVAAAKQRGELVPEPCEACGAAQVQAHHDDYSKHLEVRWLCRPCHRAWHVAQGQPMGPRPGSRGRSGDAGRPHADAGRRQPVADRKPFRWRGTVRR